jgi:acetyl esterase/lipase
MKNLFSFLLLASYTILHGQTATSNKLPLVEKTTHTYYVIPGNDSLKFDFYKPKTKVDKAPLLLYVHGGGFSGGQRDDNNTVQFANKIADRGYAVASISYQLTMKKLGFGCNTTASDKIKSFDTAANDVSLAIKHILENNSIYNIDPTKVVISGTSAGAEAVLHLAYVKKNSILPDDFKFAGVISFAGAVINLDRISAEKAIPTQLFHGTNDNIVPYNIAAHRYCNPEDKGYLMLYGSRAIADRLKGLGKSYYLYAVNGGTHSWSGIPLNRCITEVLDFLDNDVVKSENRQTERTIGL